MSDPIEDDDKFISGLRRKSALLLLLVGVAVVAVGAMFAAYGLHYAQLQENSEVQFALPDIMKIVGVAGAFIGGILMIAGAVRFIRK